MNKIELQAYVKGKVQGVGFRWTVVDIAEKFELKGTVKNLPNGTVQIIAQGSKESLEAFIKEIEKNPGSAIIKSIDWSFKPQAELYIDFTIL